MESLIKTAKALSDPHRVRILMALSRGELCVCQLVALLKLAPSTVSKHLSILKQADLVESRKTSRWVYFQRRSDINFADRLIREKLRDDPVILKDLSLLRKIKKLDIETICRLRRIK